MEDQMNVGDRIRFYRVMRGMSQETLALEANINTAFVGHLERGLKSPTVNTLDKISRALGITLEQLFSDGLMRGNREDQGKQLARARIDYALAGLSTEEVERVATIITEVVKFKNE